MTIGSRTCWHPLPWVVTVDDSPRPKLRDGQYFYLESGLGQQGCHPRWIREIATNGGKQSPLDSQGIQRIMAKLNQGDFAINSSKEWPDHARCEECGLQDAFEEFVPTDGRSHLICPKCGSSNCFEINAVK